MLLYQKHRRKGAPINLILYAQWPRMFNTKGIQEPDQIGIAKKLTGHVDFNQRAWRQSACRYLIG